MPANSKEYIRKNYERFRGTPDRILYRTKLNKANRERGTYGNGDGKDLMHIDGNPRNFSKKNLRTGSAKANRRAGAAKATAKKRQSK